MPQPAKDSARLASESPAPRFDALGERLAELGKAEDFSYPLPDSPKDSLPDSFDQPQIEPSKLSGSGYLPNIEKLQWESNGQGGFEAWHCPPGAIHRREKTYLGFLGVRKLRHWEKESPERFREMVTSWIAEKRSEKQIE